MSLEPYYDGILWFLRCGMWLWVIMLVIPVARWIALHYFAWESLAADNPEDVIDAVKAYRPVYMDKEEIVQAVLGERAEPYFQHLQQKKPPNPIVDKINKFAEKLGL